MNGNQINYYWLIAIVCYGAIHISFFSQTFGEQAIADSGYLSYLTIILLGLALLLLLKSIDQAIPFKYKFHLYALAYVIIIYILREADFHRLFTDEHITKGKFYTDPNISTQQKILGGVPMGLFFICFLGLIFTYTKIVLSHLRQMKPWAVALFLWGTTFFLSQLADKSDLNDIYVGRVIEETLEFCASGYVLLTVFLALPYLKKLSLSKN